MKLLNFFKKNKPRQTVKEFEKEHNVKLYHADGRDIRDDCFVENVDKNQRRYIVKKLKKN